MLPLARTSGATFSDEGVELAVVGQMCRQSPDASRPGKLMLDATIAVQVGNPTNGPVSVYPDRMILVAPGEVTVRPTPPGPIEALSIEAGTTSPFTLRFVAEGVTCSQEMRLEPKSAIESRGRPIAIAAIRFVPDGPR